MALLLVASFAPRAHALDMGDIIVTDIRGDVEFTLDGASRKLKAGAVLTLPAIVRTGKTGSVELKQGTTSIRVGPDTELNFPASESRGGPIDRIVQPRGNAFYDIGKREGRKLRVETPVLVGVVKGTQFNVAALDGSATISLFEGRLEILDMHGGVIDLQAGEMASRKLGDASTSVLKMTGKAPTGATPKNSSNTRAASEEVLATRARETAIQSDDDLASGLLASDLALASHMSAPPVAIDPGTSAPEAPWSPGEPDVGANQPDVGVITPPAEVPVDGGTAPDLGTGGGEIPVETVPPPVDTVPDLGTDPGAGELPDLDTDDGNNGHGNDDDGDDSSNPGHGRSGRGR